MSARFYEIFEWVATIMITGLMLSFPLLLWKADRDAKKDNARQNKKAS